MHRRSYIFQLVFIIGLFTSINTTDAAHLIGGELTYECLGNNDYTIRLKIYRDCYCTNCADFDNPAYVFIYNSGSLVQNLTLPFPGSTQIPVYINNPCLAVPPDICVEEAIYSANINLPPISGGYDLVYQRCCRNNTILNILNPQSTGSTYYSKIPDPALTFCNSNPYYNNFPPIALCVGDTLSFDHSATDIDGDSLVYELCSPYSGASQTNPMPGPFSPPPAPPYSFVSFVPPYSITNPLNGAPQFSIDPQTGLLYGAPSTIGQFVLGVCVKEYRNGVLFSTNKRDFQFNVVNCDAVITAATPAYVLECDDYTVNFQNFSTGGTYYSWDFGDGTTSTQQSPSHSYSDTGVYNAVLIANPGWPCADTSISTINVYPGMTSDYSYVTNCADSNIIFTDLSTSFNGDITSWTWAFGDGVSSTDSNSTHSYNTGGYYNVSLTTINDKGCVDIKTEEIYVYPHPEIDFSFSEPCVNTPVSFTNNTSIDSGYVDSWEWDIAGLQSDTSENTEFIFTSTGFFDITLTAISDKGCESVYTQSILVKPLPISNAGNDSIICSGDVIVIGSVATAGYTYNWNPTQGLNSIVLSNPSLTLTNTTDSTIYHDYIVITTADNCSLEDTVSVGVYPEINALLPTLDEQCLPDNLFFLEAFGIFGPNANFSWTLGDGTGTASTDTFSYSYSDTGTYTITLTIEENGCTSTTSTTAHIYDVPVATFDIAGTIGCDPFEVEFHAYSSTTNVADSQLTYLWNFDDGTTSSEQTPTHIYNPDGTYHPSLTIALGTCNGFEEMTQSMEVSVLPTPTAGIGFDPPQASIYDPIVWILDQSLGADTCKLVIAPGDTINTCNLQQNYFDPNNPYTDTITQYITQIVTNSYGCSDTLVKAIDILPAYIYFAPNSFTPNEDGINDLFFGEGFGIDEFELIIYDRWGDQVFYTQNPQEGWDGHVNNGKKVANQAIYVYLVNIVDIYQNPHKVVGHVSLIR